MNVHKRKYHSALQHDLQVGEARALAEPCMLELLKGEDMEDGFYSPRHPPSMSIPLHER